MPHGDGGLGGLLGGLLMLTLTCVICGKLIESGTKCQDCKDREKEEKASDQESTESKPKAKKSESIFDTDYKMFPDDF